MPTLNLDDDIYNYLIGLADGQQVSPSELLRRRLKPQGASEQVEQVETSTWVPIYMDYLRERREALFDTSSERVKLLDGKFGGRVCRNPSAAAMLIVEELNPSRRRKESNGWIYFKVKKNGKDLTSLRRTRPA